MDTSTLFEIGTLVACVLAFDTWERLRPARRFSRLKTLPLDALALGVVIGCGFLWKPLLLAGGDALHLDGAFSFLQPLRALPSAVKIIIGLLVTDCALYWVHRAMHATQPLWRTHVFHHSIEDLYWLSGARTSTLHLLLFAVPQVLIAYYVFALTPTEIAIGYSIGVLVNIWVHTNLYVPLGPLEWLIITPQFHRIHHARDILPSKNLGFILTIWDRMFGTYMDPREIPDAYALGLAEKDESVPRMIVGF